MSAENEKNNNPLNQNSNTSSNMCQDQTSNSSQDAKVLRKKGIKERKRKKTFAVIFLCNWCSKNHVVPNYEVKVTNTLRNNRGYICKVTVPGINYVAIAKSSKYMGSSRKAAKMFLLFLVHTGLVPQCELSDKLLDFIKEFKTTLKEEVINNLLYIIKNSNYLKEASLEELHRVYQIHVGSTIPFEELGYTSLKNFICSNHTLISILSIDKNGQSIGQKVADVTSNDAERLICSPKSLTEHKPVAELPIDPCNSTKDILINSINKEIEEKNSSKYETRNPLSRIDSNIGSSIDDGSMGDTSSSIGDSVFLKRNGKSLGDFPSIEANIRTAAFSTLLGLHNLLFRNSYMDCLQDKVLSFEGYLFPKNSEKWKNRELLLSVLPLSGLKEYLNLLCIKYNDKESKHFLMNKIMDFLSAPNEHLLDDKRKIDRKSSDVDLYEECQIKDKLLIELHRENGLLKDTLLKVEDDAKKCRELSCEYMNNLQSEIKKLKEELNNSYRLRDSLRQQVAAVQKTLNTVQ